MQVQELLFQRYDRKVHTTINDNKLTIDTGSSGEAKYCGIMGFVNY